MAKTNASSIFKGIDGSTPELLAESYGKLIDQIQKSAVSVGLKNTDLSGDPKTGSVLVRRMEGSLVKTYGTARTATEGDKILNTDVIINLDQKKEIVQEVNNFDVEQFGIPALIDKRRNSFALSVSAHLDRAFFVEAESAGTEFTATGTTLVDNLEEMIQTIETTSNDNVDGVDRGMIVLTVLPAVYGALENYIDTLPNPTNGGVDIKSFHGVEIISNFRQTEEAICMVRGSVAQPVAIVDFKTGEIDFSNETAMVLFFNYGTEAVMADLIQYGTVTPEEVSA